MCKKTLSWKVAINLARGFKCNVISCHVLYVWFFICFSKQVATSGFTGISKLHLVYESSDGRQICSRFGFQFEVRQCLSGSKIIFAKNYTVCHRDGSDQLFPTLLKYVNYEGSWCIETELLFKKMPPYYSSLVI